MTAGRRRGVFLDRDGVLNRVELHGGLPEGPTTLEEFTLNEGAAEAVRRLKSAGFAVIVVTNQPDIRRGRLDPRVLEQMHQRLRAQAPVDAVYFCPHDDSDGCECRKPKPGMLLAAAREHDIDLARSFMVGDRWRDIEAGHRAGCTTYLVGSGYGEAFPVPPDRHVGTLVEAADDILAKRAPPC